jgi:hypothetical protein
LRNEHKQNTLGNNNPEPTTKQRLNGLSNADTLTTTMKQSHKEGQRCQYVNHHGKAKFRIKQISNATDALTTTQVAGQTVQQISNATDALTTTQAGSRTISPIQVRRTIIKTIPHVEEMRRASMPEEKY